MTTFLKFPSLEHSWESNTATSSTSRCGRRSSPLCRCPWVVKSGSLSSFTNAPITLLSGSANLFCLWYLKSRGNGSRAHPVTYLMGTGSSFPGVKWPMREADHLPSTNAEAKETWSYSYTFKTSASVVKHKDNFFFTFGIWKCLCVYAEEYFSKSVRYASV
jgi:hypothetical protein